MSNYLTGEIQNHLRIPYEDRTREWQDILFILAPKAQYYNYGVANGPNNRPYMLVTLTGDLNSRALTYQEVNDYAFDNRWGVIILLDSSRTEPDAIISFGAIWSYKYYGDLRGCANVIYDYEEAKKWNADNPFAAFDPTREDTLLFGIPSEEFFPEAIRQIISDEIRKFLPASEPQYKITMQEKFIIPHRIMISLEQETPESLKEQFNDELTWFMPPYLPVYISF